MEENKYIKIELVKYPYLAKCECCNRVKDIFYKSIICSVEERKTSKYIVGDLDFCKNCGDNFSKALGNETAPNESTIKEFKF